MSNIQWMIAPLVALFPLVAAAQGTTSGAKDSEIKGLELFISTYEATAKANRDHCEALPKVVELGQKRVELNRRKRISHKCDVLARQGDFERDSGLQSECDDNRLEISVLEEQIGPTLACETLTKTDERILDYARKRIESRKQELKDEALAANRPAKGYVGDAIDSVRGAVSSSVGAFF